MNCTCDASYEFQCVSGGCINANWTCNGYPECYDDSDEMNCTCDLRFQFECVRGGCINNTWVCDGYADCFDGSDEAAEFCGNSTTVSPTDVTTEGVTGREMLWYSI